MGKLEKKIALVTGGNSGIGLATAKQFVSEGAYVFITGRREAELAAAVKAIGKNIAGVQGDMSKLGDLDRLFAQNWARQGPARYPVCECRSRKVCAARVNHRRALQFDLRHQRQALQRAGWTVGSVERVEINEAFAAIAIVVARELGFGDDIVNVEGGAVAHGHPIGATGAVLTTKLIHSMRGNDLKRGLVTLCIGAGQGIALAVETLH